MMHESIMISTPPAQQAAAALPPSGLLPDPRPPTVPDALASRRRCGSTFWALVGGGTVGIIDIEKHDTVRPLSSRQAVLNRQPYHFFVDVIVFCAPRFEDCTATASPALRFSRQNTRTTSSRSHFPLEVEPDAQETAGACQHVVISMRAKLAYATRRAGWR